MDSSSKVSLIPVSAHIQFSLVVGGNIKVIPTTHGSNEKEPQFLCIVVADIDWGIGSSKDLDLIGLSVENALTSEFAERTTNLFPHHTDYTMLGAFDSRWWTVSCQKKKLLPLAAGIVVIC